ncbi:hypothetical protein QQX98_005364 [Neonectria punicea]|uniref:Uncharacterized protein n=1 Tax=Neonectria punicea TaxID=979145 RepID=A0ABR1H5B5_9HYPO
MQSSIVRQRELAEISPEWIEEPPKSFVRGNPREMIALLSDSPSSRSRFRAMTDGQTKLAFTPQMSNAKPAQ